MINYFKKTIQDKSIKKIINPEIGSWINVVNPSSGEIEYLVKKFKLDKRNLESGMDQNELPRLDFVDENIYVFTKIIPKIQTREVETYLIVISKSFILTLSKSEPSFIEKILEERVKFITTQKLKCLIELFSLIDKNFQKVTIDVVKTVQNKRKLATGLEEKELKLLLTQEGVLNDLFSSYYHMNLLYERIVRKIKFFEQDKEIIEDLIIEATQGLNLCKSSLKSISNIRSYYVILLSNKLNKIITILTIFTILVSLPAAISGIYGMNILLPFQENPLTFYYLLCFIVMIWISLILYLKKKKVI